MILFSAIILVWFLTNRNTSKVRASFRLGLVLLVLMAVTAIIFPDFVNKIAHSLGVGRGADLVLYALTLSFIALALSIYVRTREDKRRITVLARKIAIIEANQKLRKS